MIPGLQGLESVFGWLLEASWQASVLALLVLFLQRALGARLNPRWRYALWLLVLLRLVLPVLPESALSLFQFAPQPPAAFTAPVIEPLFASESHLPPSTAIPAVVSPSSEPHPPLSLYSLLAIGWLVGALGLLFLTWEANRRFVRQIRNSPEIADPELLRLFDGARAELGIGRSIRLIENGHVQSPAIMGLFSPTLLLPTNVLAKFDEMELRLIFLHELAHLKRGDVIVQGIIALLQIIHWFNPVLWYAFRRMRADREPATDALVLSRAGEDEKERYGLMLIKLFEHFNQRHSLPTLVGILEDKDQFKRRFSLIARFTRGAYGWSMLSIVLIVVLMVVGLTQSARNRDAAIAGAYQAVWAPKTGLYFKEKGHAYFYTGDSVCKVSYGVKEDGISMAFFRGDGDKKPGPIIDILHRKGDELVGNPGNRFLGDETCRYKWQGEVPGYNALLSSVMAQSGPFPGDEAATSPSDKKDADTSSKSGTDETSTPAADPASIDSQLPRSTADLDRLQKDLQEAKIEANAQRVLVKQTKDLSDDDFVSTMNAMGHQQSNFTDLQKHAFELKANIENLLAQGFEPNHPHVVALKAELESARQQIKDAIAGMRRALAVNADMAQSRVELLAREVNSASGGKNVAATLVDAPPDIDVLKKDLLTAKEEADARQVMAAKVKDMPDTDFVGMMVAMGQQQSSFGVLQKQAAELKASITNLVNQGFEPNHPRVAALKAELQSVQQQLKNAIAGMHRAVEVDAEMSKARVDLLTRQIDEQKAGKEKSADPQLPAKSTDATAPTTDSTLFVHDPGQMLTVRTFLVPSGLFHQGFNVDNVQEGLKIRGIVFPPGATATFLPGSSKLVVRNTPENLDRIASLVELEAKKENDLTNELLSRKYADTDAKPPAKIIEGAAKGDMVPGAVSPAENIPPDMVKVALHIIQIGEDDYQAHRAEVNAAVEKGDYKALSNFKSFDLVSEPCALTKSGEKATLEAIRVMPFPVAFEKDSVVSGKFTATDYERRNLGTRFLISSTIKNGKNITVTGKLTQASFEGWTKLNDKVMSPTFHTCDAYIFQEMESGQTKGLRIPGIQAEVIVHPEDIDPAKVEAANESLGSKDMKRLFFFLTAT